MACQFHIIIFNFLLIAAESVYSSGEEVTDGEISLSVKYGFLPVYSNTFNLCSELLRAGTKCPLPKGVNIITVREVLPRTPPVSWFQCICTVFSTN